MIFYVIIIRVNKVKMYVFYYIRMCFIFLLAPCMSIFSWILFTHSHLY